MTASGSWKTSSGLLDDFDFSIEEAWFGTNEKFGDQVLLNLRGIAEQMVEGEMAVVDDEHLLLYSCGEGWEAAKGGREAVHAAGKTTFTNQSNMGRLIDAIVGLGKEVIEELESRGDTYQADTWEGLRFHIERKQFSFRNRETQEQVNYEVPLPIDYLGTFEVETEEAPKRKPAKKKAATRGKAAAKTTTKKKSSRAKKAEPEEEEGDDLREAVVAFASDYEDHADFVEEVFDPAEFDRAAELQEDEELSEDVLDEDGSIWTEAQE